MALAGAEWITKDMVRDALIQAGESPSRVDEYLPDPAVAGPGVRAARRVGSAPLLSVQLRDGRLVSVERALDRPARGRGQPVHRPLDAGGRVGLQHLGVALSRSNNHPAPQVSLRGMGRV